MKITPAGLLLQEIASDTTIDAVRQATAAELLVEGEPTRFCARPSGVTRSL